MKKLLTLIVVIASVASAWAIHEDRPPGAEFHQEQSADIVAAQQAYAGRVDSSGGVPLRTEPKPASGFNNSKSAAANLNQANRRQKAVENLKAADQRMKNQSQRKGQPWWFAAVLVGLGVLGWVGFRDYMVKSVPAMPVLKKRRKKRGG